MEGLFFESNCLIPIILCSILLSQYLSSEPNEFSTNKVSGFKNKIHLEFAKVAPKLQALANPRFSLLSIHSTHLKFSLNRLSLLSLEKLSTTITLRLICF